MKKNVVILFFVSLIFLPSCLNESKFETTPAVLIDQNLIVNGTDTIGVKYLADESKYCFDTIAVDDTLCIWMAFDAVGNNLTKGVINYKSEFAELTVVANEDLSEVITPTVADGSYSIDVITGYRAIILQLLYVPVKAGTGELQVRVESDSQYSPAQLNILTPIREKEVVLELDTTPGEE